MSRRASGSSPQRGRSRSTYGVRFAVIGQGPFAQTSILPAFTRAKGCELSAIFSDDETKLRALRRRYGVEHALPYLDYDVFLESGAVDAVYIALPNDMHADYALRAARAGVHVLCERPMAVDSREAEQMIATCQQAEVRLMIAYRQHFDRANRAALGVIEDGRIGEPRFFSSVFSQRSAGGSLRDIGISCIRAARTLFRAEPVEVVAIAGGRRTDERLRRIDEQVSALLRFPGDRLAQLTCGFGGHEQSEYTAIGTRGRLRLDRAYGSSGDRVLEIESRGRTRRRTFRASDRVAPELAEFAACIQEGRDPELSGQEGLADLRVIEAIEASLRSGEGIRVRARQSRKIELIDLEQLRSA